MRFTRVTLFFIAFIISLGFYQLARHFLAEVEPQTFQATEEMMVDAANLLAEVVEPGIRGNAFDKLALSSAFKEAQSRKLDARIFEHLKTGVGLNAYITDEQGIVIFDSDRGWREGRNLRSMRDVSFTLAGRYGARSSRDDPQDASTSVLYVAAPIGDAASPLGVLTVYKPQRDVMPLVRERRRIIYMACGLIGGGILFLIAAVFLWLFRPIGRITDYALAIERGERPAKPHIGIGREVNTLAHALDSMRDSLENRNYVEGYVQTLTHEMKSPLAAIRGAAELMGEDLPPETRNRFLENILSETARSERLITRMLELSAVESRRSLDDAEECDIGVIIASTLEQARPMAEVAGVSLRYISPHGMILVRGNAFILRAAVTNLLENAIDFSPTGEVVEVSLQRSGDFAILTIRDHGEGIPDFARERVFEKFYSLRHHRLGRKGTGLGLSMVKEAADLHGGSISVTEAGGGGTTATFRIPAL